MGVDLGVFVETMQVLQKKHGDRLCGNWIEVVRQKLAEIEAIYIEAPAVEPEESEPCPK